MRILLTGGAGFIGSALIRYLLRHTDSVIANIDALSYAADPQALADAKDSPRYHFFHHDITDFEAVQQCFQRFQPTWVVHLAAESHVDNSISSPNAFIHSNIVGTYHVLEASRQYWQQLSPAKRERFRLLHVSTDEVYGDLAPNAASCTEETAYAPSSPYSASKASADHLVRAWHRTYQLPVLLSCCSNNYGPFQHSEKLIPHMITQALVGNPLPIYGDGQQIRDWLHVDDHVRALHTILLKAKVGESYNISAHCERTNLQVVHAICNQLDLLRPHLVNGVPRPYSSLLRTVTDRPGHDRRYALNAEKIQRQLGWMPEVPFEQGLAETVAWYVENKCEHNLLKQGGM